MNNKGTDQTVLCAFVVSKPPKTGFLASGLYNSRGLEQALYWSCLLSICSNIIPSWCFIDNNELPLLFVLFPLMELLVSILINVNYFHASLGFSLLLIGFANSLDADPRSGPKPFDALMVFLKELFEKVNFEISEQTTSKA